MSRRVQRAGRILRRVMAGCAALCLAVPGVLAQVAPLQQGFVAKPQGRQVLRGHVPPVTARLQSVGRLPSSTPMRVAMGLPLRNQRELDALLRQLSDPTSPHFRQYLTSGEFAARFGPAPADYEALMAFARNNGLTVTGTHPNRTLLDVSGTAGQMERVFHVRLLNYRHPTEARNFFAPDREPSLDLEVRVLHIGGLDNCILPRPAGLKLQTNGPRATPLYGSGPGGTYLGADFRTAYAPGVTLRGNGQAVGLLELDGYYSNDIAQYESLARLPNVPLTNILVDGFNGSPGVNNVEVALDIEMAISMAPGLSNVLVYEGTNGGVTDDILNRMATDNLARQLSASWAFTDSDNTGQIYAQFVAQGQSFLQGSGDDAAEVYPAWLYWYEWDADKTFVGGTVLTTAATSANWAYETTWSGSGGGIDPLTALPSWQRGLSTPANQGSATYRNIPDVACVALSIWVVANNGSSFGSGGTSAAAPLWAGFIALANEQAANSNKPPVGFLNPPIYAIGKGPNYSLCFHDITTGNNENSQSPNAFSAVAGYDLCTGWGTPRGSNLISALAGLGVYNPPTITGEPASQTLALGSNAVFSVTATGDTPLSYQWRFDETNIGGAILSNLLVTNVTRANAGSYTVVVTNKWGSQTSSVALLNVGAPPSITTQPATVAVSPGATATFAVGVSGDAPLSYQWQFDGTNVGGATNASLTLTGVTLSNVGSYTVVVTNVFGRAASDAAELIVQASPPAIVLQPVNHSGPPGGNASLSVAVTGFGPFSYQWQRNGVNLTNIITTVAGNGNDGSSGDGGAATNAAFYAGGVAVDGSGNLFIADSVNDRVRKVAANGMITTVAGNGTSGHGGDGGPATNASLFNPSALAVDALGNLFIADSANQCIRQVGTNGLITTVAGNGSEGYGGDGGPATNASLSYPGGVAVDALGNLFIADENNNRIRQVGTNGLMATVAGNGTNGYFGDGGPATNASLANPAGVAVDLPGNLFIADGGNKRIRKLGTNGFITTVAGSGAAGYYGDGGPATNAFMESPTAAAVDPMGRLLIADAENHRIRVVDAAGIITTLAGNGGYGFAGDGGPPAGASLSDVYGAAADASGNVFIADTGNHRVREVVNYQEPTLILFNLSAANAGEYDVVVTSPYGIVTSTVVNVAVGPPPTITEQPANLTVANGANASFTVAAAGAGPLTYQWRLDGSSIAGATDPTLNLTNAQIADAGVYSVVVTGTGGPVPASAWLNVATTLGARQNGSELILDWAGAWVLQVATNVGGPYADLPGASSPFTNQTGGLPAEFFRLRSGEGISVLGLSTNGVLLGGTGAPGYNYLIEASSDLTDWTILETNTAPFQFMDVNAADYPIRYYRMELTP
jgi:hypothetical protein